MNQTVIVAAVRSPIGRAFSERRVPRYLYAPAAFA